MGTRITLALDVLGGDYGSEVTVAAACQVVKARPEVEINRAGLRRIPASYTASLGPSSLDRLPRAKHKPVSAPGARRH